MERICTFGDCDKKHKANGLCKAHYDQVLRGNPLKPLRWSATRICDFSECSEPHYAKGLCGAHYEQVRRGESLTPIRQPTIGCEFPGCERPHDSKGLCRGHRSQRDNGNPLSPIRQKNRVCEFPECDKPHYANGLCSGHRAQRMNGNLLTPFYSTRNRPGTGRNIERNKVLQKHRGRRYKERKANAVGFCTKEQLEARIQYYGGHCAYCRGPFEHIDHCIPLSKGGSAWPANLVPSCASCNLSKKDKNVWEWLKEIQSRPLF